MVQTVDAYVQYHEREEEGHGSEEESLSDFAHEISSDEEDESKVSSPDGAIMQRTKA
jgi:hypothetical protein